MECLESKDVFISLSSLPALIARLLHDQSRSFQMDGHFLFNGSSSDALINMTRWRDFRHPLKRVLRWLFASNSTCHLVAALQAKVLQIRRESQLFFSKERQLWNAGIALKGKVHYFLINQSTAMKRNAIISAAVKPKIEEARSEECSKSLAQRRADNCGYLDSCFAKQQRWEWTEGNRISKTFW